MLRCQPDPNDAKTSSKLGPKGGLLARFDQRPGFFECARISFAEPSLVSISPSAGGLSIATNLPLFVIPIISPRPARRTNSENLCLNSYIPTLSIRYSPTIFASVLFLSAVGAPQVSPVR